MEWFGGDCLRVVLWLLLEWFLKLGKFENVVFFFGLGDGMFVFERDRI